MQIVFEADTPFGPFSDALYFEDDAVPDAATIEAMKQQRIDNWIAIVAEPVRPNTVEIVIEVETSRGTFTDVLYFDSNAVPDAATIEVLKQQKVDLWLATAPPPFVPEYVEIDGVKHEKIQFNGQIFFNPVEE